MKKQTLMRHTTAAIALLGYQILAGCANTSPQRLVEEVNHTQQNQAGYDTLVNALEDLGQQLATAEEQQLSYYAPEQMQDAQDAVRKARDLFDEFKLTPEKTSESHSLFSSTSYGQKTQQYIDDALQALEHAGRIKLEADTVLAESFEYLAILEKLDAPAKFSFQYRELKQDHDKLVEAIADGDIADAKEALPELLKQERALEIAAAQRFYLHELNIRLNQHRQSQLDRDAPISMEAAVAMVNRAGTLIATDPRDATGIGLAVADARFAIEVAESVAAEVKKLRALDRGQLERVVLDFTSQLNRVSTALNQQDVRNRPLNEQVSAMVMAATSRQQELADTTQALTEANSRLEQLGEQQGGLEQQNQRLHTELAKLKTTLEAQQQHWQQQLNEAKLALATQQLEQLQQQLATATRQASQPTTQEAATTIQPGSKSPQADAVAGGSDSSKTALPQPAVADSDKAEPPQPVAADSRITEAGETAAVQPATAADVDNASQQEEDTSTPVVATGA